MWDLVPCPGIETGLPALGTWSLSHWTSREFPRSTFRDDPNTAGFFQCTDEEFDGPEEISERGFPGGSESKNLPAMQETQVRSLGWEDPWRRECLPTPAFWLG